MRTLIFSLVVAAALSGSSLAQGTWLDKPIDRNWNDGKGIVPKAPRNADAIDAMCQSQIRPADSLADKAVTRAGWFLYGAAQIYGNVTLVTAMASVDGMCRPNEYNAFVFVANRFAGTLSPIGSIARSDGAIGSVHLTDRTRIIAEFVRYSDDDALCCPSRKTYVEYKIMSGTSPIVKVEDTWTEKIRRDGEDSSKR